MTEQERSEITRQLELGRDEFLAVGNGVTEEAARKNPAEGRWSILEIAEHVAAVESYLYSQVEKARTVETPVVNPRREQLIPRRGLNRELRVEAPAQARPAGRFPTLAAALESFTATRARTLEYVVCATADQRARMTTHPLLGDTNCWEMLLLMAMHPRRHAGQIREVRQALGI